MCCKHTIPGPGMASPLVLLDLLTDDAPKPLGSALKLILNSFLSWRSPRFARLRQDEWRETSCLHLACCKLIEAPESAPGQPPRTVWRSPPCRHNTPRAVGRSHDSPCRSRKRSISTPNSSATTLRTASIDRHAIGFRSLPRNITCRCQSRRFVNWRGHTLDPWFTERTIPDGHRPEDVMAWQMPIYTLSGTTNPSR